jgi:hypothetical protein
MVTMRTTVASIAIALAMPIPISFRMQILGDRSWWLPGWMERLIPRATLEPAGT